MWTIYKEGEKRHSVRVPLVAWMVECEEDAEFNLTQSVNPIGYDTGPCSNEVTTFLEMPGGRCYKHQVR